MDHAELKKRAWNAIDEHRERIVALGEDIRKHPELGFKETRTASLVADWFAGLGISHETGLAITGVKGRLEGDASGPTVAYLGELDSVLVSDHPEADPVTGAAHACGHNASIAQLAAVAVALAESGVWKELFGTVALMAVPAEEYVEVDFRLGLRREGKLEFLGGKPELLRVGAFDDVDIVFMTHLSEKEGEKRLGVAGPSNGCVVKQVRYVGRAAHAGGAPHAGVNALNAAMLGMSAINANRETFRDEDHIRVHPIITKGGELVNVVPAEVCLETFVRGASVDAIMAAAEKVDRCLRAGAMGVGAAVEITTLPGYLPRIVSDAFVDVYRRNAEPLVGGESFWSSEFGAGSTDMGDLSHVMPALEAQAAAARGTGHGNDYRIVDEDGAYILPAKSAVGCIIDLLADSAQSAHHVIKQFEPAMTKAGYLEFMRGLYAKERWSAQG